MIRNLTDQEFIKAVFAMRQGGLDEKTMAKVFRFESVIRLRQCYMDAANRFRKQNKEDLSESRRRMVEAKEIAVTEDTENG